jgi:hypothetical protein
MPNIKHAFTSAKPDGGDSHTDPAQQLERRACHRPVPRSAGCKHPCCAIDRQPSTVHPHPGRAATAGPCRPEWAGHQPATGAVPQHGLYVVAGHCHHSRHQLWHQLDGAKQRHQCRAGAPDQGQHQRHDLHEPGHLRHRDDGHGHIRHSIRRYCSMARQRCRAGRVLLLQRGLAWKRTKRPCAISSACRRRTPP